MDYVESESVVDNTWCVYMHTNLINGKRYIGITSKRPNERWKNGKGYSPSQYFYNAIQKYGWDSFSHEIILSGLSEADAKIQEIALIYKYQTMCDLYGYNLTAGGNGALGRSVSDSTKKKIGDANRGRSHTDEVKAKISQSLIGNQHLKGHKHSTDTKKKISQSLIGNCRAKGHKLSSETRERMAKAHTGKRFSESHRASLSSANKGRIVSEETRLKISMSKIGKSHKGCKMSELTKKKMSDSKKELFDKEPWRAVRMSEVNKVQVDMLSIDGSYIRTFSSARDAFNELGIDNSSICKVCKGKAKSAGGFLWRYHTE